MEGKEYYLNAWVKEGRSGKFLSLSVKPKDEQRQGQKQQRNAPPAHDYEDMSGDVPF